MADPAERKLDEAGLESAVLAGVRVMIVGGSDLVGLALAEHLAARGAEVVSILRRAPKAARAWRQVVWEGRTVGAWRLALDGASGLINLAGRSVNCVWPPGHQDEILRSRVKPTRALGALRSVDRPHVWVQLNTAHVYGDASELAV